MNKFTPSKLIKLNEPIGSLQVDTRAVVFEYNKINNSLQLTS